MQSGARLKLGMGTAVTYLVKTHAASHSLLGLHSLTAWLLLGNNSCKRCDKEVSYERKCKPTPQSDPGESIGVKL